MVMKKVSRPHRVQVSLHQPAVPMLWISLEYFKQKTCQYTNPFLLKDNWAPYWDRIDTNPAKIAGERAGLKKKNFFSTVLRFRTSVDHRTRDVKGIF